MDSNIVSLVILLTCLNVFRASIAADERPTKTFVGLFNVVKFNNDACQTATNTKNGTCYTEEECEQRGGLSDGTCAEGYGVCCVFHVSCGQERAENMTYFTSSQVGNGACNARICKSSSSVHQLRLDFVTFQIDGPSTSTSRTLRINAGSIDPGYSGQRYSEYGVCTTDTFSVPGIPVICGLNTGYHIFVDINNCNMLSFHLDDSVNAVRQWEIRVTQYEIGSLNAAPKGCLQYFYGSTTGHLETFNKANNIHLANQNHLMCVRREEGKCRICYSHDINDFGTVVRGNWVGSDGLCCNYERANDDFDCVIIPMPTVKDTLGKGVVEGNGNFCGTSKLVDVKNGDRATICSQVTPFQIRFLSDHGEYGRGTEAESGGSKGFKLHFEQFSC